MNEERFNHILELASFRGQCSGPCERPVCQCEEQASLVVAALLDFQRDLTQAREQLRELHDQRPHTWLANNLPILREKLQEAEDRVHSAVQEVSWLIRENNETNDGA